MENELFKVIMILVNDMINVVTVHLEISSASTKITPQPQAAYSS